MYDIRQFRPALYVLLILGISGFAIASESLTLWLLGVAAVWFNALLVRRGRFRPMPRIVSNLITILALIYIIHEVISAGANTVLMIGQFLLLLHVVKLWEQRGNRDYGQLLVLSLLIMVAAAISTATLLFGLLLVVYLFLSLYCCLLFHLKVETDAAKAAMTVPTRKVSALALRQDQRHLSRSMRKLTLIVSSVAIVFAVLVFVFFPRGAGAGILGSSRYRSSQSLVGFGDEVSFQNIARIQQNDTPIARVTLIHNDRPVRGDIPLLLRGVTLDTYAGKSGDYRWLRWSPPSRELGSELRDGDAEAGEVRVLDADPTDPRPPARLDPKDRWVQDITLLPTGTDVMFAMAGPYSLKPATRRIGYRYWVRTGELRIADARDRERSSGAIVYQVVSSNDLGNAVPPPEARTREEDIDPAIRAYALRPEVSGSDTTGPLGPRRYQMAVAAARLGESAIATTGLPGGADEDIDFLIAQNIERHLKSNFAYTLDLTDTRRIEGRDPLVAFLYDFKKGHCEYFAGAMTLLCQSLGIKARMCLGFYCDEFNSSPGADYYIVRQSHAHAWVEVLTRNGWKTFDPTSERDVAVQVAHNGLMQKIRHLLDFLEYTYGNSVIAYTNEDRSSLIQNTESAMLRATAPTKAKADRLSRFFAELGATPNRYKAGVAALLLLIGLMACGGLLVITLFALERWRLRRRARRIGIGLLPEEEQLRLARQLQFYDSLVQLLDRHQMRRAPSQTPMEFSNSLLLLPAEAYETIRRLTRLFYGVRYGHVQLTPIRQQHLDRAVEKLAQELSGNGSPKSSINA